jgi:hypothetical protein
MEAMRKSWTDERLDDFREHVEQRFQQVDQRFDHMEQRFDRIETELRTQRAEITEGFRSLYRATLQIGAGMFGTLMLAILTMLSTHG